MKVLTIDTSSTTCSVALTIDDRVAGEFMVEAQRTLTNHLLSCVETLLKHAGIAVDGIDCFGVALGPGSFTGVRVGVATVKGLALATSKPVVGFSSLAMLAAALPHAAYPVCPMFDARKKEVYAGIYRCDKTPESLLADCVLPPADLLKKIQGPTIFTGDGATRYRDLITTTLGPDALFAPWNSRQPRASSGALIAVNLFKKGITIPLPLLTPSYIRPSEAELAKRKS